MSLKLIVIYAAHGDALLLQTPDQPPKYWLIDGGPVSGGAIGPLPNERNAYYQYLKRALYRYCSSQRNGVIDNLSGIVVTHPDGDHMDGINRLLRNDITIPNNFKGPVLLNSTFYRRGTKPGAKPGIQPFEYPLTEFLDQVDNQKFGLSMLPDPFSQPDPQIPTNMKNVSLAGVYKMVHGAIRNRYPQPGEYKWGKQDLDSSSQNWSSIITLWPDPGPGGKTKLSLVTTGDGLPSDILDRMMSAKGSADQIPDVGTFKVSHHGSENNSQWAENAQDYVNSGNRDREREFFFFLTMVTLQYNRLALLPPPSPQPDVAAVHRFLSSVLNGSPMLDWTTETKEKPAQFTKLLERLSEGFSSYIATQKKSIAKVDNVSFDLQDKLQLRDFGKSLVGRYNDRKAQVIENGRVAEGTPGASVVKFPFEKDRFKTDYMKTILITDKSLNPKFFESLFSCLDSNALDDLRKGRLVQHFYSRFTADNYVISGNRYPHFHPRPTVVAGLMAQLITMQDKKIRRIFVTDGASVPLDYVYDLLTDLLSRMVNPPMPADWSKKVVVYYLATNFLAEIPVDLSRVEPVIGGLDPVARIDFSAYATKDGEEYLTFLQKQFMKALPYDVPRAAISHTSLFRIRIHSAQDPAARYLDMDTNGNLIFATGQPLFNLRYIDHTPANVNKWIQKYKTKPHFALSTNANSTQLISDLVFIRPIPTRSDSQVDKDPGGGQVQTLHLSGSVISFQTGGPANTVAIFQFERDPGPV